MLKSEFLIGALLVLYRQRYLTRNARHIWFWRNSPLMITGVVCFFFGGIISEVVQSLLLVSAFIIVLPPAFLTLLL